MTTIIAGMTAPSASAQESGAKPPRLFEDQSRMAVTLKGPWRRVTRRASQPETFPGELLYTDASGQQHGLKIGISKRGLTRRDKVCAFPPLKLWFDKDQRKGTPFRGQGSLKMVTHCKTSEGYQQYYIREYLIYRMYNLITPYSFRVRPMMVTYLDTERDSKPLERFGFLIEDIDDVAERNGLKELEIPKISPRKLDLDETGNFMLFQYLIGNLDWSATSGPDPVECCHNSKLIGLSPDMAPVFSIPYDFDYSGLVNARYAGTSEQLPVGSIRQRLYRGFCIHNQAIRPALNLFRDQRQNIMDLFNRETLLTNKVRSRAMKYLDGFYDSLAKPGAVDKLLIGKCRG